MVLRLKLMGKLITFDNYLGVRQNQGLAWSSDSNLGAEVGGRLGAIAPPDLPKKKSYIVLHLPF